MNILNLLRITFSPKTFEEEDSIDFANTKELISDEAIRNKFLYRISENEKLTPLQVKNSDIEALADKHWKNFKTELTISDETPVSNLYPIFNKIAAAFLFIVNPVMLYKTFEKSLNMSTPIENTSQPFLFSVDSIQEWKGISMEGSILLITLPVILFLVAFTLKRKTVISPAYYLLFSVSIILTYGYYGLTCSESVLPLFASSLLSLLGMAFFLIRKGK